MSKEDDLRKISYQRLLVKEIKKRFEKDREDEDEDRNIEIATSSSVARKSSSLSRNPTFRESISKTVAKKSVSNATNNSQNTDSHLSADVRQHTVSESSTHLGKRSTLEEENLSEEVKPTEQNNRAVQGETKNASSFLEHHQNENKFTPKPSEDDKQKVTKFTPKPAIRKFVTNFLRQNQSKNNTKPVQFANRLSSRNSFTFLKLESTTDLNKDYNIYIFANLSFSLASDKDIDDFLMWSNDEEFGFFDDIIFDVLTNDCSENYAIHCISSLTELSLASMSKLEGDFSLNKYFNCFLNISENLSDYKLVLLTPQEFSDRNKELTIQVNDEIIQVKIKKSKIPFIVQKCQLRDCCYVFEIDATETTVSSSRTLLKYKEFFKRFVLWCGQPSLENSKRNLSEMIKDTCSCDKVCHKYVEFVKNWILQEGEVEKFTKSSIQRVVCLHMIDRFIQPLVFGTGSQNATLLQEVMLKFNVTVFETKLLDDVIKVWKGVDQTIDENTLNLINNQYQISDDISDTLSDKEKTKFLWIMKKCPLILHESSQTYKAVNFCEDGQFVILSQNDDLPLELPVFRKLSDIENFPELYQKIIKNFKCCLAGENVSLKGLDKTYKETITSNELVQMVTKAYSVKNPTEELPVPYIERMVSRNVIDYRYLENLDKETLVLVSNASNRTIIEKFAKQGYHTSLDQKSAELNLWIVENQCLQSHFDQLCRENKNMRRYHHLWINDGNLEWLRSKGNTADLDAFRNDALFTKESSLFRFDNNVNIIVDEAGTGKSVLLKRFTNTLPSFNVYLSSSDISHLCQDLSKFKNFLLEKKFPQLTGFSRLLFHLLLDKNKVVFLWDGLDELSSQHFNMITEFIQEEKNSVHFITCRSHLKESVEKRLCSLSRTLAPFSPDQTKFYIQERLQIAFPTKLENKISKINTTLSFLKLDHFLEVPIQLFMLTELFINNEKLVEGLISVTDLYKHFIEEKLKQSYKHTNITYDQKKLIENYQQVALVAIFDKEVLTSLNIDASIFHRIKNDSSGFFSYANGKPQFFHYSYAEYFVATYFVQNYSKIPNLRSVLFDKKYTNIRFFFDVLLADKSLPHLAVLYMNLEVLKQSQNLQVKDAGGRNILQLVCSWGVPYPVLKFDKTTSKSNFVLDEDCNFPAKEESVKYKEVLEFVLKKIDVDETDHIFRMNALEYARNTHCMYAILSIIEIYKMKYLTPNESLVFCNCLYYAVRFGFHSIIQTYADTNAVKMRNGNTLLHIAAKYSQLQCVQSLLSQEKYKKCVNIEGENGETPLHLSARTGNYKITQLLINSGGDVHAKDAFGRTPIFCAAASGRHHVVQHLIKFGAVTNSQDKHGRTPLSYACENGFANVVEVFKNKVNFDATDRTGWSPLFYASKNGREEVVKLLLEWNSCVNHINEYGKSALVLACEYGHKRVVEVLIKAGANINMADNLIGWTPIFYAAKSGHEDVVEMLITNKANINVRDKANNTPSFYCNKHAIKKMLTL